MERVPSVFLSLALVYAIMQTIGLVVICDPPYSVSISSRSLQVPSINNSFICYIPQVKLLTNSEIF